MLGSNLERLTKVKFLLYHPMNINFSPKTCTEIETRKDFSVILPSFPYKNFRL